MGNRRLAILKAWHSWTWDRCVYVPCRILDVESDGPEKTKFESSFTSTTRGLTVRPNQEGGAAQHAGMPAFRPPMVAKEMVTRLAKKRPLDVHLQDFAQRVKVRRSSGSASGTTETLSVWSPQNKG